jgi:hypothetical protein
MRLKSLFVALFVLALASACGGDDNGGPNIDGGGGGGPDGGGGGTPDGGGGGGPDADTNAPATGLGQVCGQAAGQCPAGAMTCADLDNPQDQSGFCTLTCGTGPFVSDPQMAMAPEGGNAICEGAYSAPDGTPACVLYSNNMAMTEATWYCGVLCGTNGGMEFGECPGGLSCLPNNLCDD